MLQARNARWTEPMAADWPYWAGGAAIAAVNTILMVVDGKPWGITSMLTHVGSRLVTRFGAVPQDWFYFQDAGRAWALTSFSWWDETLWLNLGIIAGVFLASFAAGEWRVRSPRSWRIPLLALTGGLFMGYGTRLALGCNAGALLGGIPSMSLHGWIFAGFTLTGVALGMRLFRRLL
ncbi:MAG: YeeE/YedE thiosulfate transporter family protein [Bacillota bacterium]